MGEVSLLGLLARLVIYGQRMIVYPAGFHPHPRDVRDPRTRSVEYELLELRTPDKVTIHCHQMLFSQFYKSPSYSRYSLGTNVSPNGRATVIMFHGNAMNHGDLIDGVLEFLQIGCNVVTVSYRGYGHSEGKPTESGLRLDSQTVLNHVLQDEVLSSVPIIVYGQSLGGAVAIDLAHSNPRTVSALIIENTFLSIPLLVKDFPPPLCRFSWMCTQQWPSVDRMRKIPKSVPILMLGGSSDTVIPPSHLQGLWAVAALRRGPDEDKAKKTSAGDHVPGCFSHFKRSSSIPSLAAGEGANDSEKPQKKIPEPSTSEVLKNVEVRYGAVRMENGKDRFRLFHNRDHQNTCVAPGYWKTIRTFIHELTETTTNSATASTSAVATTTMNTDTPATATASPSGSASADLIT